MDNVTIKIQGCLGEKFIAAEFLPSGKDEYYLRNEQLGGGEKKWRNLSVAQIEQLVKNGNTSCDWQQILVTDQFDADQIRNCEFFGFIRIGRVQRAVLEHHEMQLPVGIVNSRIVSCDIGDDVSIQNVSYLAHYIIGQRCILFNVDEMHTTNHAKFGNGIVKDGEQESVRVWMDLMNEAGGRRVLPFDGMLSADAYLWAKYRDDKSLQESLEEITQKTFDSRRGFYGMVGRQCVIKNSGILKDVKVGDCCYIKGANKLKNLTINSSEQEPTQIGEGVEMVNGILGTGCHIFYGCKAVRFVMGSNSNLKYGARLLNSYLGDNSTVSCCEMLNNLIFPAHEQHHNNSFLIAAVVMGQSNLAAGATIGSNHNSRANDNEIQAGRGFWPGLCTSVKHSSRFASFTLLAKADYPCEMDIRLPFSLVSNNAAADRLEVTPAFWWLYNMYALARNNWKFKTRDKRVNKQQNIEFDCLAPDTVEEILQGRRMLEELAGKAYLATKGEPAEKDQDKLAKIGREVLEGHDKHNSLEILAEGFEKSKRKVVILRAGLAWRAYGQMLHYYAVKNLMEYLKANPEANFAAMKEALNGERKREWINLGGQLVSQEDADRLRADIGQGRLSSWQVIHGRYDELWKGYPLAKQRHAWGTLCELIGTEEITKELWTKAVEKAIEIQEFICQQVYLTRKKDFDNPFMQATYRNAEEMAATVGTIDGDNFVKQVRGETEEFKKLAEELRKRH